jgi:predicted transposase YbfD/YdcC
MRPGRSWPRSGCAATRCVGSDGHQGRPPCVACWPASTPGALDLVIGRWLADQQPPQPQPAWRRAVAVDGKTLGGSGRHGHAQVHLLAVMDHTSCAVLGQTDVDHTTNEIARFRPLLDGLDLAGRVITADALHTHRDHADWLVTAKHAAAYVLIVKTNHPTHPALPAGYPAVARHPSRLADWIRGHRGIEALHHIRDTTFAEDASQTRTGTTPRAMASLRRHPARLAQHRRRAAPQRPRRHPGPATAWHHQPMKRHHLHPGRGPARAAHQQPPRPRRVRVASMCP